MSRNLWTKHWYFPSDHELNSAVEVVQDESGLDWRTLNASLSVGSRPMKTSEQVLAQLCTVTMFVLAHCSQMWVVGDLRGNSCSIGHTDTYSNGCYGFPGGLCTICWASAACVVWLHGSVCLCHTACVVIYVNNPELWVCPSRETLKIQMLYFPPFLFT